MIGAAVATAGPMGEVIDLDNLRRRRDGVSPVVDELQRAGLSTKTIEHYKLYIRRAEAWCKEHGTTLLEVSAEELARFVSAQGAARGSQRVIRCALAWYWRTHGRSDPPLDAIVLEPAASPALRSALSDDEVAQPGRRRPPSRRPAGGGRIRGVAARLERGTDRSAPVGRPSLRRVD